MKPSPVRSSAAPRYPTKLEFQASPQLLEEALPASWRRSEVLSAVAGVALLAQTACGSLADEVAVGRSSLVAPVSPHGEGVAGVGCVVVSPPVFLSEEEALKVIQDEAAKRGIDLVPNQRPVFGSNVVTKRARDDGAHYESGPFVPDLADLKKHVAVEFVDRNDADGHRFEKMLERSKDGRIRISSASDVETRNAAESLAARVNRDGITGVYFGAFYDPAGNSGCDSLEDCENGQATDAPKLEENKELLRAQVKDFLDWLQAQGAL